MDVQFVKVARQGDVAKEVNVSPTETVEQVIAKAGFSGHSGRIYAKSEDGESSEVALGDAIEGIVGLVLTTNVKGGC